MSKAIMLIHGFLTSVHDFGRLYDYLDFYDKVVPVKIPGHDDEADFTKFTVTETMRVVETTFDELNQKYDCVDVVGFSMGGALTSYLCATRNVRKAVMLAPANKFLNFDSVFAATKYYLKYFRKTFRSEKGRLDERISAANSAFDVYRDNMSVTSQLAVKRFIPNLNPHTFRVFNDIINCCNQAVDKKDKIDVPALMRWGRLDELVPKASVQYVDAHFTNCQTKIIEDMGHLMLMTNKDNILIRDIVKFLSDGQIDKEIPFREATIEDFD